VLAAITLANKTTTANRTVGFASLLHSTGSPVQLYGAARQMSNGWTLTKTADSANSSGYRQPASQLHIEFYVPAQPGSGLETKTA